MYELYKQKVWWKNSPISFLLLKFYWLHLNCHYSTCFDTISKSYRIKKVVEKLELLHNKQFLVYKIWGTWSFGKISEIFSVKSKCHLGKQSNHFVLTRFFSVWKIMKYFLLVFHRIFSRELFRDFFWSPRPRGMPEISKRHFDIFDDFSRMRIINGWF